MEFNAPLLVNLRQARRVCHEAQAVPVRGKLETVAVVLRDVREAEVVQIHLEREREREREQRASK